MFKLQYLINDIIYCASWHSANGENDNIFGLLPEFASVTTVVCGFSTSTLKEGDTRLLGWPITSTNCSADSNCHKVIMKTVRKKA